MRLSPDFALEEFSPPPAVSRRRLDQLRQLCQDYLQPLRDEFGRTTITSGFRSRHHNVSVGGAPMSYHVWMHGRPGVAADVVCQRGNPRQWYEFLDRLGAPGLGLYDTHVHVDNRQRHARW